MNYLTLESVYSLRAQADGWSVEDTSLVDLRKPVGLTEDGFCYHHTYPCPLYALADGWGLIGPPTHLKIEATDDEDRPRYRLPERDVFVWLFKKDEK